MSTTPTQMFEAIKANPSSDGPRLASADALTAQGDPRGEFIAIQCRLAAAPAPKKTGGVMVRRSSEFDPEKLRRREAVLLGENRAKWTRGAEAVFHRGFIEGLLKARPRWFVENAVSLLSTEPLVTGFHVHSVVGELSTVLSLPLLRGLPVLRLETLEDRDAVPLRDASLPALTSLDVRYASGNASRDSLAPIFAGSWTSQLKHLTLINAGVDVAIIDAIVAARFPLLETLDVGSNGASAEAIDRLCASALPERLSSLSLAGHGDGLDHALIALLARPLPKLRVLDLHGTDALHHSAILLEAKERLPSLEVLDLRSPLEGDRIPSDRRQVLERLRSAWGSRVLLDEAK